MSHELDTRINEQGEVVGKAMFYVARRISDTPWHRLGTAFPWAPSLEDAMIAAGHNFEVEKRQVYFAGDAITNQSPVLIDGAYATVRTDRNEGLGIVTDRYRVLQNKDAFTVLQPLLDKNLVALETGGTLRGGQDVWMMIRFDHKAIERETNVSDLFQEIQPFGLIWNNHAGRSTVTLMETPVRVVCANTLAIALAAGSTHSASVRHTGDVAGNVKIAADLIFNRVVTRYTLFAGQRDRLKQTFLPNVGDFDRLVTEPVVRIKRFEDAWSSRLSKYGPTDPKTTRAEKALERQHERRERLIQLWDNGDGHTGDRSAWEAYNALMQALDHDALFQRESKTQAARLRRQQDTVKTETLRRLLRYSSTILPALNPDDERLLKSLKL